MKGVSVYTTLMVQSGVVVYGRKMMSKMERDTGRSREERKKNIWQLLLTCHSVRVEPLDRVFTRDETIVSFSLSHNLNSLVSFAAPSESFSFLYVFFLSFCVHHLSFPSTTCYASTHTRAHTHTHARALSLSLSLQSQFSYTFIVVPLSNQIPLNGPSTLSRYRVKQTLGPTRRTS